MVRRLNILSFLVVGCCEFGGLKCEVGELWESFRACTDLDGASVIAGVSRAIAFPNERFTT